MENLWQKMYNANVFGDTENLFTWIKIVAQNYTGATFSQKR